MITLDINLGHKTYKINIKRGIISQLGRLLTGINPGKIAVITDTNINKLYGKKISDIFSGGFDIGFIVVEPGEKSKSIATLQYVYKQLLNLNITRSDTIITFGGGVVGDLGGFAASTFLRGIPYIQIPTSLTAQIDSSIGGKVAVDLPEGKNLIGGFYHPDAVFIDPDFLETLDERFFSDGMAEAIKYGCIEDFDLFKSLMEYKNKKDLLTNMEQIIYKCCSIKKSFVEEDEKDTGKRMILNFGHTLGHAIEKYFNYNRYTHGEAVAVGMYQITKKSEEMGITRQGTQKLIKTILTKYKLPYEITDADTKEILRAVDVDKKNRGEYIDIVLLKSIEEAFIKRINRKDIFTYFL